MVKLSLHSIAYEAKTLNLAKEGYTTFYVDGAKGSDLHDGGSWVQAFKTIQHAVDESESWAKVFIRSLNNATATTNTAAGQKDVKVSSGTGFSVGDVVLIRDDNKSERATVAAIVDTILTMANDLSNTYQTSANAAVYCVYDENATITKDNLSLIGEDRDTTIISSESGDTITVSNADDCMLRLLGVVCNQENKAGVILGGSNNICQDCGLAASISALTYGCCDTSSSSNAVIHDIKSATTDLWTLVRIFGEYSEVYGCVADGQDRGISIGGIHAIHSKIHDNDISNCNEGISIDSSATYSSVYHNNLVSNTAQINNAGGSDNKLFENFYDNHTTDANEDGLCDTAYGEDYQPVSRRNGWKQVSLGNVAASGAIVGKTQIKTIAVTAAANAAVDTTLGTVTTQGCIIQGVVVHADAAQTADLTSCPVLGGAAKVLTFISATDAIQANIDAEDKQIGWDGEVYLPTGSTIVMVHNGSGATALDLTVTIRYAASVNGGYLA